MPVSATQEVAYESLLKQRRQEIHERIAQAIEELYADRLEEHYELLAHHYELSDNAKRAVDYLMLAGENQFEKGTISYEKHKFFMQQMQRGLAKKRHH